MLPRPRNEVSRAEAVRIFRDLRRGRRKYRNTPTAVAGWRFDSKREADYFRGLELLRRAGKVRLILRQVPFHLPGHTIYRLDFLVVEAGGGIRFFDVKGMLTQTYKIKKRQVEELYGIAIEEV